MDSNISDGIKRRVVIIAALLLAIICGVEPGGALGQTYKCDYVSGKKDFVWSNDQEESFRVPTLSASMRTFQVDSTCPKDASTAKPLVAISSL